jgi:hypothetical protein
MGYDTMRMWEALYLKTIPIVTDCVALRHFQDLPVIFSKDFTEINENYLNEKYEELKNKEWNHEKLFMPYWKNTILSDFENIK